MEFKLATRFDGKEILQLMKEGIAYLKAQGSPQWQDGFGPDEAKVMHDISQKHCYILVNEHQQIVGTAALIPGVDPAYTAISEGQWEGDAPYLSIHRVAVNSQFRGYGYAHLLLERSLLEAQRLGYHDVRIDTHRLNTPMQRAIAKAGFQYRGVVHFPILNGERLAYQKINTQ